MGAIANFTNSDLYEDTLAVTCESFLSIFAILLDSNHVSLFHFTAQL